jgi:hypothetical protein
MVIWHFSVGRSGLCCQANNDTLDAPLPVGFGAT